jgi:hypothetical protein
MMDKIDKLINKDQEELLKLYEAVKNDLQMSGHEVTLHRDYSGRGMYGGTTVGLSGDFSEDHLVEAFQFTIADMIDEENGNINAERDLYESVTTSAREVLEDIFGIMLRVYPRRQDSMGLGRIYYL